MKVKLTRWAGSEQQTIEVEIDAQGDITATVQGIAGPGCAEVSRFLDELGQVTEDQNTSDYYQTDAETGTLYGGLG